VFSWQSQTLDQVVVAGDKLYTYLLDTNCIRSANMMPSVPELPKQWHIDGHKFAFKYDEGVFGSVNVVEGEYIEACVCVSLSNGLKKAFSTYDTCLFTMNSTSCAIIAQGGQYAVVDPHAHSADGKVDGTGKSVAVYFSCLDHVYSHICRLAADCADKGFEICGVSATIKKFPDSEVILSVGSTPTVQSVCTGGEKRRCEFIEASKAKKQKTSDVEEVESDDVFIADVSMKMLQFNPLTKDVRDTLCQQLNMEAEIVCVPGGDVGVLGVPCKKEKIVGDGNCFFRAVSQAISGTQKNHRKIRVAVVKQM